MTQLIPLDSIPLTKLHIAEAGQQMAATILDDGKVTPLSAYIKLRALRDALDVALKEVAPAAFDEAERDPGETLHGVGWQVRNGRTSYRYDHDSKWQALKEAADAARKALSSREKFLQQMDEALVDPVTGEYVEPAEINSVGAPVLALVFPKE